MRIVGLRDGFILTVVFVAAFGVFSWRSLQEREARQVYVPQKAALGATTQDKNRDVAQVQIPPVPVQPVVMDTTDAGQYARSEQAGMASLDAVHTGMPVASANGKAGGAHLASSTAGSRLILAEENDADAGEADEYGQKTLQQLSTITNHNDRGMASESTFDSPTEPVETQERFETQEEKLSAYNDKVLTQDYPESTDTVDDYDDRSTARPDYEDVYPGCPGVLPPSSNEQMAAERLALYGCVYYAVCELPTDLNPVVCTWYLNHKV